MDRTERRERAALEAAEWMLRLAGADMSRTERADYFEWLRESPLHVAEMLRVTQTHKRLSEFEGWKEMPPADPSELATEVVELRNLTPQPPLFGTERTRRPWRWAGMAAATGVAVVAMTVAYFSSLRSNVIVADAGQRREITLSDGTRVRLSPRSRLEVHFTEHERDVRLAEGDVLFTVAKDPSKPFIVETGHTRVRAIGTVFGVERDGASVIVTVQEGRVAVANSIAATEPALQSIPVMEISLGANQQITVSAAGPMSAVRKVDSRRELSWAEGRLIFEKESVADVVRRFNRFNRMQMKVTDPALAAQSVTAVFDATDPEAFIIFLESVADVRVIRSSPDEILIASEGPR